MPDDRNKPTRRDLLRWSGLSVAIPACQIFPRKSSGADSDSPAEGHWIDAHVHVWTPDVVGYPLAQGHDRQEMSPASFTPTEWMAHAAPCGVTRAVLIQMSFYGFDNRYMLDTIAQQPTLFRGVAVIDEDRQPQRHMRDLVQHGVRGIRIMPRGRDPQHWLRGVGMREMWTSGADHGVAMCHLIDAKYLASVASMCQDYPQTPVVIDHIARIGTDGTIHDLAVDQLCRLAEFDHVRVKLSAFYALGEKRPPYRDLAATIARLLRVFGPERLMWASDCPYQVQEPHTYRASFDLLHKELGFLSHSDREWLLRKTAERQFFS